MDKKPQVFISYAWESDAFRAKVRKLRDWLMGQGVTVVSDFDHYPVPPEIGWPHWMQHAVEDSAVVLVVCSPKYKPRFEKRAPATEGKGVTWEAVFMVQSLYNRAMRNERIYPIFPDQINFDDCPTALEPWSNGHAFPSGQDGILALVRACLADPPAGAVVSAPVAAPSPTPTPSPTLPRVPGLLRGPTDGRLQPREGRVYGRIDEIEQVLQFLHGAESGAVVCAMVAGAGGIGKTEVCKAALKQWLAEDATASGYFIVVPEHATAADLLYRIGSALGLEAVESFAQLCNRVLPGLYYLDNLEGVAETQDAQDLLKDFVALPGVRVLASSRVKMPTVLRKTIPIDVLPDDAALQLFRDLWPGEDALPDEAQLKPFVVRDLGAHALAVTLCARLGDTWSFDELRKRWAQLGVAALALAGDDSREASLRASLALTAQALAGKPAAVALWTVAALFTDAIPEAVLGEFEEEGGWADARKWLVKHHVLIRRADGFHMLPPLTRFALGESLAQRYGFNWEECRKFVLKIFIKWLKLGIAANSPDLILMNKLKISINFGFFIGAIKQEMIYSRQESNSVLQLLKNNIYNITDFFSKPGIAQIAIAELGKFSEDAETTFISVADLELLCGKLFEEPVQADEILEILNYIKMGFLNEKIQLSQARIKLRLGLMDQAHETYVKVLGLFKEKMYKTGQADTFLGLGDFECKNINFIAALNYYLEAYEWYFSEKKTLRQIESLANIALVFHVANNISARNRILAEILRLNGNPGAHDDYWRSILKGIFGTLETFNAWRIQYLEANENLSPPLKTPLSPAEIRHLAQQT